MTFFFAYHVILGRKLGICGRDDLQEPVLRLRSENTITLLQCIAFSA